MNVTLADIANYRNQLNSLEKLIVDRDTILNNIFKIDTTLKGILGEASSKKHYQVNNIITASRSHSCGLATRIQKACSKFPEGITLRELTEELGVEKSTASSYVYSSRIGGKFLRREYSENGKAIWFFI